MTRLINLESLVECYQYTQIFHTETKECIPRVGEIPRSYQKFLQEHLNQVYTPVPFNLQTASTSIGTVLNPENDNLLFIVRDTVNLIDLKNLFRVGQKYLYASAYYYWNYYSEIDKLNIDKPIVFIDLTRFECEHLIPITLERVNNSPYCIPLINANNAIEGVSIDKLYNQIYQEIASLILAKYQLETYADTVDKLSLYFGKIGLIEKIRELSSDIHIPIEINHQNQLFYKIFVCQPQSLIDIVWRHIQNLGWEKLCNQYPQYQFMIISEVIKKDSQQSNLTFVQSGHRELAYFLAEQKVKKFPLFGLVLEKIQFKVQSQSSGEQWIQVPSDDENGISWEGESKCFRGKFPTNKEDVFSLSKLARLPIKINGQDYQVNGVPQEYHIEIPELEDGKKIQIYLEFNLTPGSNHELKVIDVNHEYKIITAERDCIDNTGDKGYIPAAEIRKGRIGISQRQIQKLHDRNFDDESLQQQVQLIMQEPINYRAMNRISSRLREAVSSNKHDLLRGISILENSSSPVIGKIRSIFSMDVLNQIIEIIQDIINQENLQFSLYQVLKNSIIFLGKTYSFSEGSNIDRLFELKNWRRIRKEDIKKEYFFMLSRVAINSNLSKRYFEWFDKKHNNKYFYQLEYYLWGYSRILLWYADLMAIKNSLAYEEHFWKILQYLNTIDITTSSTTLLQNCFLALIYLLGFREFNPDFCSQNSPEYHLAEEIIARFRDHPVTSRQIITKEPLNGYFDKILHGTSIDTRALIEVE